MSRQRDISRKYLSGAQKRALRASREAETHTQSKFLEKFITKKPKTQDDPQDGPGEFDSVSVAVAENTNSNIESSADLVVDEGSSNMSNSAVEQLESVSFDSPKENVGLCSNLEDPGLWPLEIQQHQRDLIVSKGPQNIPKNFIFPRDEITGRSFSETYLSRILPNGEKVNRQWLVYSASQDSIYCFCCKLFNNCNFALASKKGFRDWVNASGRLSEHEKSVMHMKSVVDWVELEERMSKGCTVDKINQQQINEEKARWRNVLERILAITQYLAEHNMAFRGSVDQLFKPNNGNFLGLVQLIATFDPIMQEHLRRVKEKEMHDHYLGKEIQNELISLMGKKVRDKIVQRILAAKYFSVILDCTPDAGHQEQMSLVIRFVSDGSNIPARIYEHFITFINIKETTGKHMLEVLFSELRDLGLDYMNIRGQGYDNGANMKGSKSGVQARLLQKNPRAFFTPCACHNYNLLLGDIAKTCKEGLTFFGIVQRLYVLFSASTSRWNICRQFVKTLSPKPLSETRWECRIDAVKALRYQVVDFYDALTELAETNTDPQTRSEAMSLAKELTNFKFLVALVCWHNVLFRVNVISKMLQGESIDLKCATESFNKLCEWLKKYRMTGLEDSEIDAKEIAEQLNVECIYKEDRLRRKKKTFDEEAKDEPIGNPRHNFRVNFFYAVFDKAVNALEERFGQLKKHFEKFGFLLEVHMLDKKEVQKKCIELERLLTYCESRDIDGLMLAEEMEILKSILPNSTVCEPLKMLKFLSQNSRSADFPNFWIALRILLTIPVSVASGERSFSKLKLIKSFLRSTMMQGRLNELTILSIEHELSKELDYNDIINDFASRKARKALL